MSIFDEGQARLSNKRFERLQVAKQKQKMDAQKYSYATYQGKDPVDGTDIVQVGSNEPVSGFKLISNAPMAIDDRVALRKNNQGGLQRVDDRNRLITEAQIAQDILLKLGRCVAFGFTADVEWSTSGGGSTTIQSSLFLSAASSDYAREIFSLVGADTYSFNSKKITPLLTPHSNTFDLLYTESSPLTIPPTCIVSANVQRDFNGIQWVDTVNLEVDGWISFTITSISIQAYIYTFANPFFGTTGITANNGAFTPYQKISDYQKLGFKSYQISLFNNDTLIDSGVSTVNWSSFFDPSTATNVGGVALPLTPSTTLAPDGLSLGSSYWVSTPIL